MGRNDEAKNGAGRPKRKVRQVRKCCDWDTFLWGFLDAARRRRFPLILVNRCEARKLWRHWACTGAEALTMIANQEAAS